MGDDHGNFKVIDFGCAFAIARRHSVGQFGTRVFWAEEMLASADQPNTFETDVCVCVCVCVCVLGHSSIG